MNGKGSVPRPFSVPLKDYEASWSRIFGDSSNKKDQNDGIHRKDQRSTARRKPKGTP